MDQSLENKVDLEGILPGNTLKTRVPQVEVERKIKPAQERYRNELAKYIIFRNEEKCNLCGTCVDTCPKGVHVLKQGYKLFATPESHKCNGSICEKTDNFCISKCPQDALRIVKNPMMEVLGDNRWPSDMILATWKMAETGNILPEDLDFEYETGNSGGGFDRIRIEFPEKPAKVIDDEIDISLNLNKRNDGRPKIKIDVPWYGGGMSFGSISNVTQLSRVRAAVAWNTFSCSGEGGYMERLRPYDDHMITQVATGLFGVREETIQRVRIVEFKYAQGAKPGLGGHLLGTKNTPSVAKMREAVQGIPLFSPFPFHSVYSIEDHMKHIDWIKHVNPRTLVSTKVSTPTDVDMVAVGSYYAGTHIIHIDGGYGGTGAAPDIAKKNIAMPIDYAIPKVHNFLVSEGARDIVTLIASGGIRNYYDVAKAIALGADGVVIGTAELVALCCLRCSRCSSGRGCPRGIATTDPGLITQISLEWGTQRIINLYNAWAIGLKGILKDLGMKSIKDLRGRTDLLKHLDISNN
jgi:glutamate synthase domain-containing protein 2/ferredoxin